MNNTSFTHILLLLTSTIHAILFMSCLQSAMIFKEVNQIKIGFINM